MNHAINTITIMLTMGYAAKVPFHPSQKIFNLPLALPQLSPFHLTNALSGVGSG